MAIILGDISPAKANISDIHSVVSTELSNLKSTLVTLQGHWQDEKSANYINEWSSIIERAKTVADENLPKLLKNLSNIEKIINIYRA